MVDRTLLLRKLSELDEYMGQLREYHGLSARKYRADWRTLRIVERLKDFEAFKKAVLRLLT